MSDIIEIAEKATAVREQWRHADIWEIADRLGILCLKAPLGTAEGGLKGYCTSFFDQFVIAVNAALPSYLQRLIAWHELGHIILDPDLLRNGQYIPEHDPLHMKTAAELRANYFAAAGAIDGRALMRLLREGYSVPDAAAELLVPPSFVIYKADILRAYGEELRLPELPDADCLAEDITGRENF
ncbi:MAG: ImmA/IrrE family metallo-endopeptidase [Oscillospiraceae bacterium]|nr:ImmA/IrrE family metallo-endopeptidase [Oscillospiraceae bacterium]